MATERFDNDRPKITLALELNSSLTRQLDKEVLRSEMGQDLRETLLLLGVPGEPQVEITTDQETDRILTVFVNGRLCPYSTELLLRVYNYVADEDFGEKGSPALLLRLLQKLSAEEVGSFARLTCREIMARSPALLLTVESAAAYRAVLANGSNESSLPDAQRLHSLLSAVLNLRISIADLATTSQILKEKVAQGKPNLGIAEDLIASLRPKAIEVQMSSAYLKQITLNTAENDLGVFSMMRDGLFYELGVRYPTIRFVPTDDLKPESFRFGINHLPTLSTRGLRHDEWLVSDEPNRLRLLNIQGRVNTNPANLSICSTIRGEDTDLAEEAELTTWNQIGFLILAMSAELRNHARCFLDREEVEINLTNLELVYPQLVEAARTSVSLELMTQTMRLLLAEQISIRNLRGILQSMINLNVNDSKYIIFDPRLAGHHHMSDEWMHDPVNAAAFVRAQMKQQISHKYTRGENTLVGYLLDPEIEAVLANDQKMGLEDYLMQLEPGYQGRILAAMKAEVDSIPPLATSPIVFTTSNVRPVLRELTALEFPQLAVLCYQELSPDMNIQPIGRIAQ